MSRQTTLKYFPWWRNHLWVVQLVFQLLWLIPADFGGTQWVKWIWVVFSSIFLLLVTANIIELMLVLYRAATVSLDDQWRLFPDYLWDFIFHTQHNSAEQALLPTNVQDVKRSKRRRRTSGEGEDISRFNWSLMIHLVDLYWAIDIAYLGVFQTLFLFNPTRYFSGLAPFVGGTIYAIWAKLYFMTVLLNSGTGFGAYITIATESEIFALLANYTNKLYFLLVFGYLVTQVASVVQKRKLTKKSSTAAKIL